MGMRRDAAEKSAAEKIKVLYIAGWGRSGSTLVGNVLSQLEGYCHVGELWYLWDRGMQEDRTCGCGQPLSRCEVWQAVLQEAFGGRLPPLESLIRRREQGLHNRHVPAMLLPGLRARHRRLMADYPETVAALYGAIRKVTGCTVIVDSSKYPSYAHYLSDQPSLDLHLMHLVRDCRAVAFSWQRKKKMTDTRDVQYIRRYRPAKAAGMWWMRNLTAQALWLGRGPRYLRMRYEDLISDTARELARVAALLSGGGPPPAMPFITAEGVLMRPTHTVSGNPMRLQNGVVPLRLDSQWTGSMRGSDRATVTLLTWPMLLGYGYPLQPR